MARRSPPFPLRAAVLAVLIMVLGAAITGVVARKVRGEERVRLEAQRDAAALQATELLSAQITGTVDLMRSAAALYTASPVLDQPTFSSWSRRVVETGDYPGLFGLSLIARVPDEDVERWAAERNAEPGPPVQLDPIEGRAVHNFIEYTSNDASVLGLDLSDNPTRDAAMQAAIDTGLPTISDSFVLTVDAELPVEQQRPAFSIYVPIYAGGVTPPTVELRRQDIIGFASGGFRATELLEGITARFAPDTQVLWFAGPDAHVESLIASSSPGLYEHAHDHVKTPRLVEVGGQQWRIDVVSHAHASSSWLWLWVTGLARSVVVGLLLAWLLTTRTRLRRAHTESQSLLAATLDAVGAGVITCDVDGKLTYVNDEARRIHGVGLTDAKPEEWAATYRIHTLDGEVAPLEDVPLWRALHGEAVTNVELLVCRPGEPRRVVATSARPVVSHGRELVGAVTALHDVTDRVETRDELARQATTDALTGLGNRRAAFDELERRIAADDGPLSVVYVDLDGFKPVNDEHGHDAGDAVLCAIAGRIATMLRDGDRAYRIGGDEFLVVLEGDTAGPAFSDRLHQVLNEPVPILGATVTITASVGCATSLPDETADELVRRADQAMLVQKRVRRALQDGAGPRSR